MKRTRLFAFLVVVGTPFFLLANLRAKPQAGGVKYFAYVGTYTSKTESKGIYRYGFDASTGKLSEAGIAAETPDPSFLVVHPNGKFVYAVNEGPVADGGKHGAVTSFSIDAANGKLTERNQVSSLGVDPCFLSIDKTGKFLLVANYTSGNITVFPILADGKIGEATANVPDKGELGPNKQRQEAPHAHWVQTTEDNRFAIVVDLGLDLVLVYKFDATNGTLAPNDPPSVKIKAGSGPRHMVFSANEKYAYVASELASTVTALKFDAKKGTFKEIETLSTLPPGFSGRNDVAEIALHPNGRFLYVSNRGNDSIAVYEVAANGSLTPKGGMSTGGKEPRHFTFDPSGKYLFAENQHSDKIDILQIDASNGQLSSSREAVKVPSPVCVVFLTTH